MAGLCGLNIIAPLFAFSAYFGLCGGTTQQWVANTNFDNDKNWDTGHVPCGPVTVRIPELNPQIYVQLDSVIKELILPNNVEMILGDGLNLAFSDNPNPTDCKNPSTGDVNFIATSPESWFDPDNWCPSVGGACNGQGLLDTEQVPCTSDDVIFPVTSSYYINLESGYDIKVGSMSVSGQSYSTDSFKQFLSTDLGRRTFPPPSANQQSTINVMGNNKCTDVTGCACGNDGKISEKICAIKSPKCATPNCGSPLRPKGSCCDVCGAILTITYGNGFRFNFVRDSVKSDFVAGKANAGPINYFVSKRSDNKIQMVLTDSAGNNSIPVAEAIKAAMDKDISAGGSKYGITSVSLEVSKGAFNPPQPHTGGNLDGGQVAGLVIGLIIATLLILVIAFFVYRRKTGASQLDLTYYPSRGLTWVRDKLRRSPNSGSPFVASVSFKDPENINATIGGIDNPMYGDYRTEQPQETSDGSVHLATMQSRTPDSSGARGFDNPLYGSVQDFPDPSIRMNPTYSEYGYDDDKPY